MDASWAGAVYRDTARIAGPPQRKKRFSGTGARGRTTRCRLIQSAVVMDGAQRVEVLRAESVDEQLRRLLEMRRGDPDVVQAAQTWQSDLASSHRREWIQHTICTGRSRRRAGSLADQGRVGGLARRPD